MASHFFDKRLRVIAKYCAAAFAGAAVAAIAALVITLNGRHDLSVWHLTKLDEEYTTKSDADTFAEYLALEDRLFQQLDEQVYTNVPVSPENALNRYSRGSLSDPNRWPTNWNRTFEWQHDNPRAAVLLLHGLSDSPYSMRALGETLHAQGATVLGLRMPGHGTAPSGLLKTRWQDMAAAVRLAAQHIDDTSGDVPLYIVGYSNGGALALDYALDALDNPDLPQASGLVLVSPEIGVAGIAAFAAWQGRLGYVLGLQKLAWNDILPEYDPFKYSSFAIRAGDLAYRITNHVRKKMESMENSGALQRLPPVLAFQSGVDATVTPSALIDTVFGRLSPASHELVIFDINRLTEIGIFLSQDPRSLFEPLLKTASRDFDLTIVENENGESRRAVATTTPANSDTPARRIVIGDWPADVYSLSHVALPIPPDDPLYGGPDAGQSPGVQLGNLSFRGERGVLQVSGTAALRLRWNPFYDYVQDRTLAFMQLSDANELDNQDQSPNQPRETDYDSQ